MQIRLYEPLGRGRWFNNRRGTISTSGIISVSQVLPDSNQIHIFFQFALIFKFYLATSVAKIEAKNAKWRDYHMDFFGDDYWT